MSVTVEAKVDRLLTTRAVQVKFASDGVVSAAVRGDTSIWDIRWSRNQGWACTCPHFGAECSHVQAVRSITMRPVAPGASR